MKLVSRQSLWITSLVFKEVLCLVTIICKQTSTWYRHLTWSADLQFWRLLLGLRLAGNNCFSMFYLSSTVFHKIILSTQIMECVNEIGWWLRSWNISTFWEILLPILIIFCFPIYLFSGYSITQPINLKASSLSNKRLMKVSADN